MIVACKINAMLWKQLKNAASQVSERIKGDQSFRHILSSAPQTKTFRGKIKC